MKQIEQQIWLVLGQAIRECIYPAVPDDLDTELTELIWMPLRNQISEDPILNQLKVNS